MFSAVECLLSICHSLKSDRRTSLSRGFSILNKCFQPKHFQCQVNKTISIRKWWKKTKVYRRTDENTMDIFVDTECLLRYELGLLMSVHQTKWNFMFIFNPYSAVLIRIFPSSVSKLVYSQKRAHSKMFVNDVSENHFSHWIWMVVLDVSASVCLLVWNIFPTCNFCRAHMASHLNSLWSR